MTISVTFPNHCTEEDACIDGDHAIERTCPQNINGNLNKISLGNNVIYNIRNLAGAFA